MGRKKAVVATCNGEATTATRRYKKKPENDFSLTKSEQYSNRCLGKDSDDEQCERYLPPRRHVCGKCQARINDLHLSKRAEKVVQDTSGSGRGYLYADD